MVGGRARDELAGAEPQHHERARGARGGDERAMVEVLHVATLRARQTGAGVGAPKDRLVIRRRAVPLARSPPA